MKKRAVRLCCDDVRIINVVATMFIATQLLSPPFFAIFELFLQNDGIF